MRSILKTRLPCLHLLIKPYYQLFTARKNNLAQRHALTWLTFICKRHPVICVDTDREVLYFVWHVLPVVAIIQHLSIILIGRRNLLEHEEERSFSWRAIHANPLFLRPDCLTHNNKWKNVGGKACIVRNDSLANVLCSVYSPFLSARRKIWKRKRGRKRWLLPLDKYERNLCNKQVKIGQLVKNTKGYLTSAAEG